MSEEHRTSTTTLPTNLTAQDVTPNWNLIRKQSLQLDKQTPDMPAELKSNHTPEEVQPSQQLLATEMGKGYDSELKKDFTAFDDDHRLSDPGGDEAVPLLPMEINEETTPRVKHRSKSKKSKKFKRPEREDKGNKDRTAKKDRTVKNSSGSKKKERKTDAPS